MSVDANTQRSCKKAKLEQFVLKPGPRQTRQATKLLNDMRNNKPFPFLRLPPELRNKIYNLIFVVYMCDGVSPRTQRPENRLYLIPYETSVYPTIRTNLTLKLNNTTWRVLNGSTWQTYAILRTCKQIANEASLLAWRRTNFDFSKQVQIRRDHTLRKTISNLNVEHLRYLTVDLDHLWDAQDPTNRDPGRRVFRRNCALRVTLLIANARPNGYGVGH